MRNKSAALLTALSLTLLSSLALAEKPQPPGKNAILLSNVQTLTLRNNHMTSARRVSPIPQLQCVGNQKICKLYQVETMRCSNDGYDYDEEDVQWTCTASLPAEFKLGSTDVICEGYRNSDDPWVLKGSCGVEYRMLLTDLGEEKFGMQYNGGSQLGSKGQRIVNFVVMLFFCAVLGFILWALLAACFGSGDQRPGNPRGRGGGGGGGGGDDGFYPGPPPPYGYDDCSSSQRPGWTPGWTPGFWSGALGGTAAGYHMGRNSHRPSSQRYNDYGEGSSRSSSTFSPTTTGTGFGSTRRR